MDSGADASGAGPLAPGSVLGKYQILRLLAVGGMAELYLCRATGLGGFEKAVALKRILPGLARDPEFVEMFLDEARLTASLNHPNLIQVHDVDRTSDGYFFSMEYVHGKSLAAVLQRCAEKRRGLSMGHALFVLSEVARGLHYAHDKRGRGGQPLGTVHRDVSPGNLMLSYEGAVKIVDFGIAKAALRATKTDAGAVKGTVYYMSPEQAQGVELDRRSDVFSLGVLLYELTTGKRPFRAQNDFAVLHKLVHDAPTPPTEVRASYPPALEAIVLRALAKRPEERFATADDLRQSLDAFVREQGLSASSGTLGAFMRELFDERENTADLFALPPPLATESRAEPSSANREKAPQSPQKHRKFVALVAALVALGVVALAIALARSRTSSARDERPPETQARGVVSAPEVPTPVAPSAPSRETPPNAEDTTPRASAGGPKPGASARPNNAPTRATSSASPKPEPPSEGKAPKKWDLDSPLPP